MFGSQKGNRKVIVTNNYSSTADLGRQLVYGSSLATTVETVSPNPKNQRRARDVDQGPKIASSLVLEYCGTSTKLGSLKIGAMLFDMYRDHHAKSKNSTVKCALIAGCSSRVTGSRFVVATHSPTGDPGRDSG